MDETLLETGRLHGEYQEGILKGYGITDIKGHEIPLLFGSQSGRVRMAKLLNDRNIPFSQFALEEQIKGKNNYIKQKIANKEVELMPYADEAIYELFDANYALAICTWSGSDIVETFLDVYGFHKQIKAIASCYNKNPITGKRIQSKPSSEVCDVAFHYLDQEFGNLSQSPKFRKYMIGDTTDDVICGQDAGATTILVPNNRLIKTLHQQVKELHQKNYHPVVLTTLKDITKVLQTIH